MEYLNKVAKMENTCVAFGSFEGMHKGHLSVIQELVRRGKEEERTTVVVSCHTPSEIEKVSVLTTEEEKAYLAEKEGVDVFISYNTEEQGLLGEEFIKNVIIAKLGAKEIIIGENNGKAKELEEASNGAKIVAVKTVLYQGKELTAELVRKSFMDSRFENVTKMCGHTFIMIGEVMHGKALGRTVGMPTANMGVADTKLKPPSGVYATRTYIEKESWNGLTNIGKRPSVDSFPTITIETFLLDFAKDIYGKKLVMEVHQYIRGVQKFNNLEEVQNQVQKDLEKVKGYLDSI